MTDARVYDEIKRRSSIVNDKFLKFSLTRTEWIELMMKKSPDEVPSAFDYGLYALYYDNATREEITEYIDQYISKPLMVADDAPF